MSLAIAIMEPTQSNRSRPPPQPKSLSPTWRYAARRSTNDPNLAALYGAALLAVEARRRRKLIGMGKERNHKSPALQSRVRCLERELHKFNRVVQRCKSDAIRSRAGNK